MKKDKILQKLLNNEFLIEKYQIKENEKPKTYYEALKSDVVIIKTLAILVDELEKSDRPSNSAMYEKIKQFLNVNAL